MATEDLAVQLDQTRRQLAAIQVRHSRLRNAIGEIGVFFEVAQDVDPLPTVRELTAMLLRADNVQITVPATASRLPDENPQVLVRPITMGGRTVGRIDAQRNKAFDEDDRALASIIGQIVGAVLEQSSLWSQLRTYSLQAQANAETLERLLEFNRQLVSGRSDQEQLTLNLATQIPGMVGGERASLLITLFDRADEPMLVLSNGHRTSPERARDVRDNGFAGLVLRERRPLIIDETSTDRRWVSLSMKEYESPTRCAMAVPLIWSERVIGALTVTTSQSRLFDTSHLNLMELVACQVALALYSAALEARVEHLAQVVVDLTRQVRDALQIALLGIQMLLNEAGEADRVAVAVSDLRRIAAALERVVAADDELVRLREELRSGPRAG